MDLRLQESVDTEHHVYRLVYLKVTKTVQN